MSCTSLCSRSTLKLSTGTCSFRSHTYLPRIANIAMRTVNNQLLMLKTFCVSGSGAISLLLVIRVEHNVPRRVHDRGCYTCVVVQRKTDTATCDCSLKVPSNVPSIFTALLHPHFIASDPGRASLNIRTHLRA